LISRRLYDSDSARFSDRFVRFCEIAASYGLTSDLEFMPWTAVPDLNTAARIVEEVAGPGAGVLVAAKRLSRFSCSHLQEIADHAFACKTNLNCRRNTGDWVPRTPFPVAVAAA
jgi:hypothetical protein